MTDHHAADCFCLGCVAKFSKDRRFQKAADRIRQLEAENARNAADLEGALQVIANADLTMDDMFTLPMKHEIRIAQLEAENARLREALLHIRDSNWCGDDCRRIARTALEGNREKAE